MIRSMTGFGRSETDSELGFITVEVRSLNSRFFNVSVRLSPQLSALEPMILSLLKERNSRGQISVLIDLQPSAQNPTLKKVRIDMALAEEYNRSLAEIQKKFALIEPINIDLFSSLPGIVAVEEDKLEAQKSWPIVRSILDAALAEMLSARESEGEAIFNDLKARHSKALSSVKSIKLAMPKALEEYKLRVESRIKNLIFDRVEIDEAKIAMEAAIISEKSDISEEVILLESHLTQFEKFLQASHPVGRHLDFLLQEMIREATTICSKTTDVELSEKCIVLKSEIDKMREQVQNVE